MATTPTNSPLIGNIKNLKVVDLRQELDKRGLEKSGLKADLVKRLEKSLLDESAELTQNEVNGNADDVQEKDNEVPTEEKTESEQNAADDSNNEPDTSLDFVEAENSPPESEVNNEQTAADVKGSIQKEDEESVEPSNKDEKSESIESTTKQVEHEEMELNDVEREDAEGNEEEEVEDVEEGEAEEVPEEEEPVDAEEDQPEMMEPSVQQEQPESEQQDQVDDSNDLPEDDRDETMTNTEVSSDEQKDGATEKDDIRESMEICKDAETNVDKNKVEAIYEETAKVKEEKSEQSIPGEKTVLSNEKEQMDVDVSDKCESKENTVTQSNTATSKEEKTETITGKSNEESKASDDSKSKETGDSKKNLEQTILSTSPSVLDASKKCDVETVQEINSGSDSTVINKKDSTNSSSEKTTENVVPKSTENQNISTLKDETKSSTIVMTKNVLMRTLCVEVKEVKDGKIEKEKVEKTREEKRKDLRKCLWISGLSVVTKAVDLKNLFRQHGKVVGAKVVTSAKTPGSQCFGFVTMSSAEEALKCIENLHKTTLHEKVIQVEKAKTDPTPSKKPDKTKSGEKKPDDKSRSSRSSTTSKKTSSSRSSRRDDRRSREDAKSRCDKKDDRKDGKKEKEVITEDNSDSGKDKKQTEKKEESVKKDSEKQKPSCKGSSPKSSGASSPKVIKTSSSKEKSDDKKEKSIERGKDAKSKEEKKDVKSLDQLRKDRAEKIEREHKLREERRKKERERERQLREERRREQEKREKERKERARREAERVRKEREKQRELEKQREREREKERERFIRERKEREEKERREREREREQLERERLERERLDRERRERERLEQQRVERERQERERLEKERLIREEREHRIERERQRLEEERLDREHQDRERRVIDRGIDRGLGNNVLKRPSSGDRDYYPEKRSMQEITNSRKDFFAVGANRDGSVPSTYVQDDVYDSAYQRRDGVNRSKVDSRDDIRNDRRDRRDKDVRRDYRSNSHQSPSADVRRVVPRGESGTYVRDDRERSPHRQRFQERDDRRDTALRGQNWLDAPNPNAPKTLSDVLGRAGLTGILGSRAENDSNKSSFPPRRLERSPKDNAEERYSTGIRRSFERDERSRYDDRGPHAETRDSRKESRSEIRRDRMEESSRMDDRRDVRSRDIRSDDRRDLRVDNRRDFERDRHDSGRVHRNSEPKIDIDRHLSLGNDMPQNTPLSVTEQRGLHPLAADMAHRGLTVVQPRILPITDLFGRPLQAVGTNAAALQAGYAAAAHGLALQQVGHTNIQLRGGRLEYTRMGQPQPPLPPMQRRF